MLKLTETHLNNIFFIKKTDIICSIICPHVTNGSQINLIWVLYTCRRTLCTYLKFN